MSKHDANEARSLGSLGAVPAAAPPRERERLQALHSMRAFGTLSGERFDRLTKLASTLFDVPISLVTLVGSDRQWFVSNHGLTATGTDRDAAFCSHALLEPTLLVVEDASLDTRFATNPLVVAAPFIRFYAGVVLRDRDALPLGTLCVISPRPRTFSDVDRDLLAQLGGIAAGELLPDAEAMSARVRSQLGARIDPLTRALGASRFLEQVDRRLALAPPARTTIALAVLSGLDQINDIFGRNVGDQVLLELARRLAVLGETYGVALLGRIGGRRLALCIGDEASPCTCMGDGASRGGQAALSNAIDAALSAPFETEEGALSPDVQVGIASADAGLFDVDRMVAKADTLLGLCRSALGGAAARRGVRVVRWNELEQRPARRRLRIAAELRNALGGDALNLVWQPKHRCDSGSIDGFECLLRWRHAELGDIAPLETVAAAQETNLCPALDRRVIDETLGRLAAWRRAGLVAGVVSVNVTAATLLWPEFAEWLAARLAEHGVPASGLELEVLESSVFEDIDAIVRSLDGLRAIGVVLALDDFGTGHSSLAWLRRLPVSVLKIDRSFVARIEREPLDVALCAGIIGLAHSLGVSVVAEGVERAGQLEILVANGCDRVQGFHLSHPVSFERATRMLEAQGVPAETCEAD